MCKLLTSNYALILANVALVLCLGQLLKKKNQKGWSMRIFCIKGALIKRWGKSKKGWVQTPLHTKKYKRTPTQSHRMLHDFNTLTTLRMYSAL